MKPACVLKPISHPLAGYRLAALSVAAGANPGRSPTAGRCFYLARRVSVLASPSRDWWSLGWRGMSPRIGSLLNTTASLKSFHHLLLPLSAFRCIFSLILTSSSYASNRHYGDLTRGNCCCPVTSSVCYDISMPWPAFFRLHLSVLVASTVLSLQSLAESLSHLPG